MARPVRRPSLLGGALFGLIRVLAPALGIARSPVRASTKENAVNVAAHALHGIAIALVTGELGLQAAGLGAHPRSLRARAG